MIRSGVTAALALMIVSFLDEGFVGFGSAWQL
jgi:hypothetical protein